MHRERWVVTLGLSLALSACATTGSQHFQATEDRLNGDIDANKVATVNRWALDHGAKIIWVSYPQKHKNADGG